MQIYFHSRLWSYLPRVPILVEGTVIRRISSVHVTNSVLGVCEFGERVRHPAKAVLQQQQMHMK